MIPYDKREGKIWYNNELVDWQDVKLHVLSHGLHYASCVFEGERVYDGDIFKLDEHTSQDFFTLQEEWVLKFHILKKKLMKHQIKLY